jgi:hypothetical protein
VRRGKNAMAKKGDMEHEASDGLESGVCIVCGDECRGIQAKKDAIITGARMLRRFIGSKKRTVVCQKDLDNAKERRKKFESAKKYFGIAAAIIFLLVMAGGLVVNPPNFFEIIPAIIAGAAVFSLSLTKYYPSFG